MAHPIKFNNFGRNFHLRYKKGYFRNVFRHYTLVLSLTPENLNWRKKIRIYFENKLAGIENTHSLFPPSTKHEYLPLVIRRVEGRGGLTEKIYKLVEGKRTETKRNSKLKGFNSSDEENEETVHSYIFLTPLGWSC